jgi:HSP20 family protein
VAFARWDPICDLLAIQQRPDRSWPGPEGWTPSIDLHETSDHYVITAELPGLAREDFKIHIQDDRVTLSGERREGNLRCEQYHRIERGHGTFSRSFQLPTPIDAAAITADLRDGVLTVTCPKIAETTRRIPIS